MKIFPIFVYEPHIHKPSNLFIESICINNSQADNTAPYLYNSLPDYLLHQVVSHSTSPREWLLKFAILAARL
jgi:hypothetical protein